MCFDLIFRKEFSIEITDSFPRKKVFFSRYMLYLLNHFTKILHKGYKMGFLFYKVCSSPHQHVCLTWMFSNTTQLWQNTLVGEELWLHKKVVAVRPSIYITYMYVHHYGFLISKNTWHSILWVLATRGMLKESKIWEVNLTIFTISCFRWMFCVFTNFSGIHSYFFFKWKDHKIICFQISEKKCRKC